MPPKRSKLDHASPGSGIGSTNATMVNSTITSSESRSEGGKIGAKLNFAALAQYENFCFTLD
jgi:hypothetical protein